MVFVLLLLHSQKNKQHKFMKHFSRWVVDTLIPSSIVDNPNFKTSIEIPTGALAVSSWSILTGEINSTCDYMEIKMKEKL